MNETSCIACGTSDKYKIWEHRNDRFLARLGIEEVVKYFLCRQCGLAYANPRLSDDELGRLYTESYRQDEITERYLRAKMSYSRDLISFLLHTIPVASGKALEIGSSEGTLLKLLRDEYGWEVQGCEPYFPYANFGINTWQIPTNVGFFRSYDYRRHDRFDLVVLVHVLEHLPYPTDFLREVGRVLAPDGLFLIETPDLLRPYRNRIRHALFPAPHLAIYSPSSITRLLSKCGFRVLRIGEGENMRVLAKFDGQIRESPPVRSRELIGVVSTYKREAVAEKIHRAVVRGSIVGSRYASRILRPRAYSGLRNVWRFLKKSIG